MNKNTIFPNEFPKQHQNRQPGFEYDMNPVPVFEDEEYENNGQKLKDKIAIITGGDSGIGKAISLAYIKEGAKVVIVYYNEHEDANYTKELIEERGGECLLIAGDLGNPVFCDEVIKKTINKFEKIDILINNAAMQFVCDEIEDISDEQFERTFKSNMFGAFYRRSNSYKWWRNYKLLDLFKIIIIFYI